MSVILHECNRNTEGIHDTDTIIYCIYYMKMYEYAVHVLYSTYSSVLCHFEFDYLYFIFQVNTVLYSRSKYFLLRSLQL